MTAKTDFDPFPVGTVFNEPSQPLDVSVSPEHSAVRVQYPSRLHAMSLDPSKITDNNNSVYTPGHINFCVDALKEITVELSGSDELVTISDRTQRQSVARHAALIMQNALGVDDGLRIDVADSHSLRHCGLGSSSSLIAGVAAAINELYGRPLSPSVMSRYVAQNHGEEIDNDDDSLMPVQCLGGSALCGHMQGGLIIAAGQATPISRTDIDPEMKVVFGVPSDFVDRDSQDLMQAEIDNAQGFRDTGNTFSPLIAYRLVHEVLPGLVEGDLKPCKDLIFDYRWDMGSIKNCSFAHPPIVDIAENLRPLRDDDRVSIISLSSAGPGFFALTKDPDYVEPIFREQGLDVYHMAVQNAPYSVEY